VLIAAVLLIIGGGLSGLAALRTRNGGGSGSAAAGEGSGSDADEITDDAFFYGRSPAVYPSREFFYTYKVAGVWDGAG
jgi:hypothetical protein